MLRTLPPPSWRALLAVQSPDSTSRGPSRAPSERWDRVAPPQDKEHARLRRRIAQLEAERDEPRDRRLQPPMWLLPLLQRTRGPATLTKAPARGPTPRSSLIPLEALEGPGGTVLR